MSFFTPPSAVCAMPKPISASSPTISPMPKPWGFKKSSAQFADTGRLRLGQPIRAARRASAPRCPRSRRISRSARSKQTGRSLDLAIDGDGFFALENPFSGESPASRRNGNFQLLATGDLQDTLAIGFRPFRSMPPGSRPRTVPAAVVVCHSTNANRFGVGQCPANRQIAGS